jgi:hypothetical protein
MPSEEDERVQRKRLEDAKRRVRVLDLRADMMLRKTKGMHRDR